MNPTKNIILVATLSLLSVAHAQTAETVKPLQGVGFHAPSIHAVAYFLSENRTCRFVLTLVDGNAQPTRYEAAISGGESTSYKITEGQVAGIRLPVRRPGDDDRHGGHRCRQLRYCPQE